MDRTIGEMKKALRKTVKERQGNLTREYIEYANEQICRNILSMQEYKDAKAVFCFVGTKDEIDTTLVLEQVLADGKILLVPKCRPKAAGGANAGIMDAYELTSLDQLEAGAYGIMEPVTGCRLAEPTEIDFAVIPCVSCDKAGHRLGHGGGYYDRYLEQVNRQKENCFPRAVVCRERLMLERVPAEATDQNMDFVVSEEGVFKL